MEHGAELTVVLIASLALAIGAGLRLFSAWSRFPYTISMLLVGLVLGLVLRAAGVEPDGHDPLSLLRRGEAISPDLIIFVFLPALVFESAYALDVHTFKKNVGAVMLLAGPALIASTALIAALMVGLTSTTWGWGWTAALVFGALISATDPVAVVAILRELGVSKRLAVLIEGESLLNDGTSIVVFTVLVAVLTGESAEFSAGPAALRFLWVVSGGLAVGLGLALLLSSWIERLFNDPLSEITLTLVLAYLAMIVAEGLLHVSGVMAVVAAGLWMSAQGKTKISPEVSHFLHRFWETLGFIANTLIFFLVGLVIATEIQHARLIDYLLIIVAYLGVMAVRFLLTYAFQPLCNPLSDGVSSKDSAVIAWGGLRGAVSLALALIVSQQSRIDADLRRQILMATAGVVFLTILVNGSTIGRLLARLGFDKAPLSEQIALLSARSNVLDRVATEIDELSRTRELRTCRWNEVEERIVTRRNDLGRQLETTRAELLAAPTAERTAGWWRRALALERQMYWEAYAHGTLGAAAVRLLSREIDRQLDHLGRGELAPPDDRTPSDARGPGLVARMLGRSTPSFERLTLLYDVSRAQAASAERVLHSLETWRGIERDTAESLRQTYQRYLRIGKERLEDLRTNLPELTSAVETRLAQRIELNLEREGFEELGHHGVLDEATAHAELHYVEQRMQALRRTATRVPIPETAELVKQTPLFAALDEAALAALAETTEEMVLPAGELLFRENDKGDSLYVIARGAVHVLKQIDGQDVLVDVLGGGDIIGEMSLLTGAPRTATVRAATSVTLGRIRRDAFDRLMQAHPALRDSVWREFSRRNFDNLLARLPRFRHLARDERRAWFERGRMLQLSSGSREQRSDARFAFVLTGRVRAGAAEQRAVGLLEMDGAGLEALEASHIVLLPEPKALVESETKSAPIAAT